MLAVERGVPVAVAVLIVLAGCSGIGDEATPTVSPERTETAEWSGTPTPVTVNDSVTVRNGTLSANASQTYARVQSLVGTDTEPWPVEVRNLSEWRANIQQVGSSQLNRALGYENVSVDWDEPTGVTTRRQVYIHPGDGMPKKTERTLAHEFVHVIQYEESMLSWAGQVDPPRRTTDLAKARRSLVEGGATYVADVYADRYLHIQSNSAYVNELYLSGSATYRSALGPYRFGAQYVDHRIDDPATLSTVYENPPRTTEQVMHNETPASEPPANLSVSTTGSETWNQHSNNTLGEMTTRTALDTELGRQRAADAATGWGTDELVAFRHARNDSRAGWTWIMRWDSASEATELENTLIEFAADREVASRFVFRVVPVGDETVVLVFGDEGYVAQTSVSGTNGNVTVHVDQ